MTKKILALLLIITVAGLVLAGCGQKQEAIKAPDIVQPPAGDQDTKDVAEDITQVDDLNQNLEDEELDSELDDLDSVLSDW